MGIETKTVTVCVCDLCQKECSESDAITRIQVSPGDGRDVGPTILTGGWVLCIPYYAGSPAVCADCIQEHMARYLRSQGWEVSRNG